MKVVQILYEKGLIKILLATETFAVGINGQQMCLKDMKKDQIIHIDF